MPGYFSRRRAASSEVTSEVVRTNVETVARLENEFEEGRTRKDRIADALADFTGSMKFVLTHIALFAVWIVINMGWIPGVPPFDKYPFIFLSMVVSLEAVLLTTFVLMKQNRMARQAHQRAHLDLQVNLLSEKEITKILQVLTRIASQLNVETGWDEEELHKLSQDINVEALAQAVKEKLNNK